MPTRAQADLVIHNGTIYDGSGTTPFAGDVAIEGDRISATGALHGVRGRVEIDASGLAVAPGFINMLSWANKSLIEDGRSQSDIRQGVTLEILGEGWSMGPLNEAMKKEMVEQQGDIKFDIEWTTLDEYLEYLVRRGVSCNVASFVGATTIRIHVLGYEDRAPAPDELAQMRDLVRQAMREGAVGLSSSLIYAPACYAGTGELLALAGVAAELGGLYISHIRNEGAQLLEAIEELLAVARTTGVSAEIYHFKASGRANWDKLDEAVTRIVRQQLRFSHLEDPSRYDRSKIAGPEHRKLAREVATKSMVLLKNDGKTLPLDPAGIKSIALLGPLADTPNIGDKGSSSVRPRWM